MNSSFPGTAYGLGILDPATPQVPHSRSENCKDHHFGPPAALGPAPKEPAEACRASILGWAVSPRDFLLGAWDETKPQEAARRSK